MKKFTDICKMTQKEVKSYMAEYLTSRDYTVENHDGFLYAKGDVPVLLVAHMDTVHKQLAKTVWDIDGKISSPQGIGGDDRCGIFIIMNIVKNLHCSVVLCEDEEVGGVGANKFAKSPFIHQLDVNYMIEFDRMNATDAVFYSCDNEEFTNFVTDCTGYKVAHGTFSDISVLAPASKIAAVNLSCGYYKAHTTDEYVIYSEMMDTIEAAQALIETECDKFEYVPKKFNTLWDFDYPKSYTNTRHHLSASRDLDIELEVVYIREEEEEIGYGKGRTKAEAWLDFFENYDDVCYGQIVDYSFCQINTSTVWSERGNKMHCTKCHKPIKQSYSGLCQSCYRYYHEGGVDNPLPPKGKIAYDHRGYVVCHICGRAYKRLGSHIKESHDMSIAEYKAEFELCNNSKTTEKKYSEHMHKLAYKYDMPQRLQETGKATRIKKGERDKRLGKKVRLQECLDKSERYKKGGILI